MVRKAKIIGVLQRINKMHIGPSTIIYKINTFTNSRIGTQQHKLQNCLSIKGETTKKFSPKLLNELENPDI
jgi:hypothetical protein